MMLYALVEHSHNIERKQSYNSKNKHSNNHIFWVKLKFVEHYKNVLITFKLHYNHDKKTGHFNILRIFKTMCQIMFYLSENKVSRML